MDIMKPDLYWVRDRCYRKNPSKNNYDLIQSAASSSTLPRVENSFQPETMTPYEEPEIDHEDEPECGNSYEIEKIENGFKTRVDTIPSSLYPHIIGAKGATKKRIEQETSTKIIVPRQNEKGDVVVRGQKAKDVVNCRRRLEHIAAQARFKREATHFMCFPLNAPHIVQKFEEFKKTVLSEITSNGLEESIFQTPEKLHLTICVMMLMDEREREICSKILSGLKEEIRYICGNSKLTFRLKGLECMNDDHSAVDVLYAKCDLPSNSKLQQVADLVALRLKESGFSEERRSESVKLHCTLLNTRYRSEKNGAVVSEEGNKWRRDGRNSRESFDAQPVFHKFGNFDFGAVEIDKILMVTRHTKGPDGFYKSYSEISI